MPSKKHSKSSSTGKRKGKGFRQGPYLKSKTAPVPPDTSRIPWMSEGSTTSKTRTDK